MSTHSTPINKRKLGQNFIKTRSNDYSSNHSTSTTIHDLQLILQASITNVDTIDNVENDFTINTTTKRINTTPHPLSPPIQPIPTTLPQITIDSNIPPLTKLPIDIQENDFVQLGTDSFIPSQPSQLIDPTTINPHYEYEDIYPTLSFNTSPRSTHSYPFVFHSNSTNNSPPSNQFRTIQQQSSYPSHTSLHLQHYPYQQPSQLSQPHLASCRSSHYHSTTNNPDDEDEFQPDLTTNIDSTYDTTSITNVLNAISESSEEPNQLSTLATSAITLTNYYQYDYDEDPSEEEFEPQGQYNNQFGHQHNCHHNSHSHNKLTLQRSFSKQSTHHNKINLQSTMTSFVTTPSPPYFPPQNDLDVLLE